MRAGFAAAALALVALGAGLAQAQTLDPRTMSAPYAESYTIWGKVADADGRPAVELAVTLDVEGPDGTVVQPVTVRTTCAGEFDAWWNLFNLTERYKARVRIGPLEREQAVDVLHRRNDFAIQLDKSLPELPIDHGCRPMWNLSESRVTVVGQVLREAPPYLGPGGNRLEAVPVRGMLVWLNLKTPDNETMRPQHGVFTNDAGVYKYSFVTKGPARGSTISVAFDDAREEWTNVTVEEHPYYYVVSRPAVRAREPVESPAVPVLLVAAVALLAAAARRPRA